MYPFDRFSEGAKKVLTLAQEEAERSHHSYIGTEHLLFGLLREGEGLGAKVLASLGVELQAVRPKVESMLAGGEGILIKQIIPTSRVKRVIELAFEEARRMGVARVGTEHLLLGLVLEGEGIAATVLADVGATLEKVRGGIDRLLPETGAREELSLRRKRVVMLGGTRFIGRAIVEELLGNGYEVLIVHRGEHEADGMGSLEHIHVDRGRLRDTANTLRKFNPGGVVDACAMSKADAEKAVAALSDGLRLVVLSSMDVYRAFGAVQANTLTDPIPLDENSPVRSERYLYRGKAPGRQDYEKLDVEEVYSARRATICRLPMAYGEHDYQRREEFILRRLRARRPRIPVGAGTWLWSRGYVRDLARGVRLALESPAAIGEVLNLCEVQTWPVGFWARQILEAAGSECELVRLQNEALLPDDLKLTGSIAQHLLASPSKARSMLGWRETDPAEAVRRSVQWHLEHPPDDADSSFDDDDRALASVKSD